MRTRSFSVVTGQQRFGSRLFEELAHLRCPVGMMIGKAAPARDHHAGGLKRREELFRPPDAGEGKHAPALQARGGVGLGPERRPQHRFAARRGGARDRRAGVAVADEDERVGERPLRRKRRPQRSARQAEPVADPRLAVDDGERQILAQRRVLQAVVHDDDAGAARSAEARAGGPVARDHGRRHPGEEQRLVADIGRAVPGRVDQNRAGEPAAIAAAEEGGRGAELLQHAREGERGRRLAGAAGREVADADHRHRRPFARAPHPPRRDPAVQGRCRAKQLRDEGRSRGAPEGRRAHQYSSSFICAMKGSIACTVRPSAPPRPSTAPAAARAMSRITPGSENSS